MNNETIVIMDFGGQYQHLIARRVREMGVYCEVLPYDAPIERIRALNPKGIIFTGGPSSVNEEGAPMCDAAVFSLGVPVLGICYGIQIMTVLLGGRVDKSEREYGSAELEIINPGALFEGVSGGRCWMSHTDAVITPPEGFRTTAKTACCPTAAMENADSRLYGVQFHPEVEHTENGGRILSNFLFNICGCKGDWTMDAFAQTSVEALSEELRGKRVLCALSGGVDSAVTATMLHKAVGDRLTCIFVDTGLMRKAEPEQVESVFRPMLGKGYVHVDARKFFLDALAGVTDPEKKRKIIGEAFIRVFEREAAKLGGADVLAQGTIYPDVIESGAGKAAVIKSHHNVGGLPEKIGFTSIVEPLRRLFKDEVRAVGRELGLPEELVSRQPFPGPGLAVRVLGEVTEEKLAILREADAIFREEMKAAGCDKSAAQYFAVLTGLRSVGVQGDGRTYWYTVALRAVTTTDFMTADWARLPHEVLAKASNRIVNNIPGVNRVVYDITSKPPATIEWE